MKNIGLPQIKHIGENYVEQWLTENEYANIEKEILQSDDHGLKARGKIENILVLVRTFIQPNRPIKLSEYEIDLLNRRAKKQNLKPYVAYVILDRNNHLVGEINWERLI